MASGGNTIGPEYISAHRWILILITMVTMSLRIILKGQRKTQLRFYILA